MDVKNIATTPIDNTKKYATVPRSNMSAVAGTNVPAEGGGDPPAEPAVPVVRGDWAFTALPTESPSNSITLTAPGTINAGDLLLIIVGSDTDQGPEWNAVSGWNLLGQEGDNSVNVCMGIYWREATGGEGNVTVTQTNDDDLIGWYMAIAGADTTTPIHKEGTWFVDTTPTPDIAGVTTTEDYCLVIAALMTDGADGQPYTIVGGTGWTLIDEDGQAGGSATDVGGCWHTKPMASFGATGILELNTVSDGHVGVQIAIITA